MQPHETQEQAQPLRLQIQFRDQLHRSGHKVELWTSDHESAEYKISSHVGDMCYEFQAQLSVNSQRMCLTVCTITDREYAFGGLSLAPVLGVDAIVESGSETHFQVFASPPLSQLGFDPEEWLASKTSQMLLLYRLWIEGGKQFAHGERPPRLSRQPLLVLGNQVRSLVWQVKHRARRLFSNS